MTSTKKIFTKTFQDLLISDTEKYVLPSPFLKSDVPGLDIFLVADSEEEGEGEAQKDEERK